MFITQQSGPETLLFCNKIPFLATLRRCRSWSSPMARAPRCDTPSARVFVMWTSCVRRRAAPRASQDPAAGQCGEGAQVRSLSRSCVIVHWHIRPHHASSAHWGDDMMQLHHELEQTFTSVVHYSSTLTHAVLITHRRLYDTRCAGHRPDEHAKRKGGPLIPTHAPWRSGAGGRYSFEAAATTLAGGRRRCRRARPRLGAAVKSKIEHELRNLWRRRRNRARSQVYQWNGLMPPPRQFWVRGCTQGNIGGLPATPSPLSPCAESNIPTLL